MSEHVQNGLLPKEEHLNFDLELKKSQFSLSKTDFDASDIGKKVEHRRCFRLFTVRTFVAFAGLVMCAQMALGIYGKSVLTSIEKRFGIPSSVAGFIAGSFNIGNLIFVVAVSKLSSTGHRPRIMAIGSLIIALGGLVNFTPHLINEPYQPFRNNSSIIDHQDGLEQSTPSAAFPHLYVILIIGEILQGIGATVLIPLSSSYIDDYASKNNSPLYLGILFVLQNIGPGFGYLIGSWTSSLYVDFDRVSTENIPISSDNTELWVGAWWLGYIIISLWVILAALPLFFFPKTMPKLSSSPIVNEDEDLSLSKEPVCWQTSKITQTNTNTKDKLVHFCQDFFQTVKGLLTNLSYMSVVFGYSGLMFVVGSLTAFMPKFLEVAFSKSSGSANLTFGLAVPPTTCFGLLFGGYVVKRFKWSKPGILKFIIVCGLLALLPLLATFFIKCDKDEWLCTSNYSENVFNTSSTTFNETLQTLRSCREAECQTASIIFVAFTAICAMLSATMVTPIYTVLLRSVDEADKCTAIGLMFFIIRGFGLIPAPIVSGTVIDETCINWNIEEGEQKNCLFYNEEQFRIHYLLLNFLAILFAIVFFIMAYVRLRLLKWKSQNDRPPRKLFSTLLRCLNKNQDNHQDKDEVTSPSV